MATRDRRNQQRVKKIYIVICRYACPPPPTNQDMLYHLPSAGGVRSALLPLGLSRSVPHLKGDLKINRMSQLINGVQFGYY